MAISEEKYWQDQESGIDRLKQADSKEDRQLILDEMKARSLLKRVDLCLFYLSGVDLREADLEKANLYMVDLSGAIMHSTKLYEAILSMIRRSHSSGRAALQG